MMREDAGACWQYEKEVTIMQQASAMDHINQQLIAEQRANSELKRMLYEKSDDGHQLLEQIERLKRQLQSKVRGRTIHISCQFARQ